MCALFNNIVAHRRQVDYFKRAALNGQLAHAYCFTGIRGIGKATFAKALIRYVLCADRADDLVKFDSGNHPDMMTISSEGNILTEHIQAVQQFIYKKPLIASTKAIVIDDAAAMVEQAQNKLLKVLEEPPGHALIILITNNANRLLATIQSRLITMAFHPLGVSELEVLATRDQLAFNETCAPLANGSYARYKALQSDTQAIAEQRQLVALLLALFQDKPVDWLREIHILEAFKDKPKQLFYDLRLVVRDLYVAQSGAADHHLKLLTRGELAMCQQCTITGSQFCGMIEKINRAEAALERGQNYTLITEALVFAIEEDLHG